MAFTLLAAEGGEVGASLVEPDRFDDVRAALAAARRARRRRPAARRTSWPPPTIEPTRPHRPCRPDAIPRAHGPGHRPARRSRSSPRSSPTRGPILWNGPMGVFELEPFSAGTRGVAQACADADAFTVVGRRRLARRRRQAPGSPDRFDHLSTGGGASLEFLEGRTLPGITSLEDRRHDRTTTDHRGELEDAQDPPGGDPGGAEALATSSTGGRRTRRGGDLPAVHRAAVGPDADRRPTSSRTASARRTSTRRTRARSRARSSPRMLAALKVAT